VEWDEVGMRGKDEVRGSLFSYVDLEQRIRPDHPLRMIRAFVNAALANMSTEFDALYPPTGRDSIPPERLLRALLLQAFFSIRSERQLVERIDFDLLFRWFVGLGVDDPVWDATTFTKNRDRLLAGEVASRFLATVLAQPKVRALLSTEHFSVDGSFWKPGPAPRASDRRTAPGRRPTLGAMANRTSAARSAATTPMHPPPIPTRSSTARGRARRRSSASWAMR
jgi:transposase